MVLCRGLMKALMVAHKWFISLLFLNIQMEKVIYTYMSKSWIIYIAMLWKLFKLKWEEIIFAMNTSKDDKQFIKFFDKEELKYFELNNLTNRHISLILQHYMLINHNT